MSGLLEGRMLARAALAAALIYVLVLKAILAPLALEIGAQAALPFASAICAHDDGGSPQPDEGLPGHDGSCCDAGCLLRLAGFVAPLLIAVALTFERAGLIASPIKPQRRRSGAGPPPRISGQPNAQRAPPQAA
jgi:hypothetical protein